LPRSQPNPFLVIVDISFKGGHGIELIKRVKSSYPNIKMLVSSGFQESLYAERAFRAGALGNLNKQNSGEKVIEAIRTVLRGERFISPEITQRLALQTLGTKNESNDPIDPHSNRELEIFRTIGKSQKSGANAYHVLLSSPTMDRHRENIKRKLELMNAAELSTKAVQFLPENS